VFRASVFHALSQNFKVSFASCFKITIHTNISASDYLRHKVPPGVQKTVKPNNHGWHGRKACCQGVGEIALQQLRWTAGRSSDSLVRAQTRPALILTIYRSERSYRIVCEGNQSSPMNRDEIISALEQERDRLNEALAAFGGRKRGRTRAGNGRKRTLTSQERMRISEGMRKSWAKRKKKK